MAFDTTHDIVPDSPTNVFATMNPLDVSSSVLSDGNLTIDIPLATTNNLFSTISFPNEGKWFFEILYISYQHHYSGIFNKTTGDIYQIYQQSFYTNGASPVTLSTNSYSAGSNSVIGLLINFENVQATVTIYINGTSVGGPYNITSGEYFAIFNDGASATGGTQIVNFGQNHLFGSATLPTAPSGSPFTADNGIGKFYYDPPTGALALCTANLPDPAIDPNVDDLPEDYMRPVVISGTNADNNNVSVGFQPDLCWLKNRNGASGHMIVDSVRGAGYALQSDNTGQEGTYNIANDFKEFTSTGFNLGAVSAYGSSNPAGTNNIISWCWKAGGAPTTNNTATSGPMNANGSTATSSNSSVSLDGVLQSSYTPSGLPTIYPKRMSVNTKAGFSIVKYTGNATVGATVPHGLSSAPDFIIIKNLVSNVYQWETQHKDISLVGAGIHLNASTGYASGSSDRWNNQRADANVVTLSSNGAVNDPNDFIMYCWHSVAGYSAFGSYTGNGSPDGPFVYTGFKPAWVMVKQSSSSGNSWWITDSSRYVYNGDTPAALRADTVDLENTSNSSIMPDYLSNGFKFRGTDTAVNASGSTYIYAAFAEQPIKYATAR